MADNYVCDGAKIECQLCTKPEGQLKVTSNEIKLQDKLFATTKDKEKVNLIFEGNCKQSSYQSSPCQSVITTEDWKNTGDLIVQDAPALLANSTIMCTYGGTEIKITDDLQQSVLTEIMPSDTDSIAPDFQPKMLIQSASIIPDKKTQTTLKRKIRNADTEQENCYAIETIEILDLDEGSDNKGNGGTEEGMIYGKEYKLKIKKYFDNKKPKYLETINWGYTYDDPSVIIGVFKSKGDEVIFKADDLELCGKMITFYAYIEDKEQEGSLDVFHHYRFRWFDREIIEKEVEERERKPFLANQKNTPLCGMAAIMYVLAKRKYDLYKRFVLELHRKGLSKIKDYSIDVSDSKHLLDMNPVTNNQYPYRMPYCDWISFSLIRDKENLFRDYDGGGDWSFDGATLPHEIGKIMFKMFKSKDIIDETNLVAKKSTLLWGDASSREVAKMQELYLKSYDIFMLIHTNMIYKKKSGFYSTIEHWVVFEGVIGGTITWDKYDFKVFTWGDIKEIKINPEVFSTNYYGYVACK
ncbi:MAG: DUF4280 domain-containing protein [Flavobacteriaceae bacterium]|nr:DUF4280 domain-containing protein [Flavobacteriaceae bacterium]